MKQCLLMFISVLVIAGSFSCSSHFAILSNETSTEASHLKEYCKQIALNTETVSIGDSLYTISDELLKKGNYEEAYNLMEQAVILYRLSLCTHDFTATEKEIATLKNTLSEAKDERTMYHKILTELESIKK